MEQQQSGTTRPVTLASLGEGVAGELFAEAWQAVLDNIEDPNTDSKTRRRVTLTFDVAPDDDRRTCKVSVGCSRKLAGIRPAHTTIFMGNRNGHAVAGEALPQLDFIDQERPAAPQLVPAPPAEVVSQ